MPGAILGMNLSVVIVCNPRGSAPAVGSTLRSIHWGSPLIRSRSTASSTNATLVSTHRHVP